MFDIMLDYFEFQFSTLYYKIKKLFQIIEQG